MKSFSTFVIAVIIPAIATSSITFDDLPQFLDQPSSTIAKPDSRIRLKCAGSTFDSSVRWYFNGILLKESSMTRRKRAKDNRNDKHEYLENEHNMPNYYRHFNRRKGEGLPSFKRNKRNTRFKYINNKGRFRRKTHSSLTNDVRPKRNANLSPSFMRGVDIREGKLIISKFSHQYVGDYYCEVENGVGTIRSRIAAVLMAELGDFDRMQLPTYVQGEIGASAVIACQIPSSTPAALSQWKINDSPWLTKSTDAYTILPRGDLLINNVSRTSSGNYTCAAYNTVLKDKVVSPVTSRVEVIEATSSLGSLIYPDASSSRNVSISTGEDLLLPCLSSKPSTIRWSKNNHNMKNLARNQEITKAGLLISDISLQGSGKYECLLDSQDSVVYHVLVAKIPNVVVTSSTIFSTLVSMQDTHVMTCIDRNNNNDIKWSWYKDGQLITDQHYGLITAKENSLTLSPVLSSMSGVYQCVATTTKGQDFATFYEDCKDDSAISATSKPSDDESANSDSASYFDAPVDENGLAAPVVTSKLRTNDPVSYRLSWKLPDGDNRVETIAIRCAKASTQNSGSGRPAYTWATQSVPASQTYVVINDLEPSSLYQLELVSVSKDGKTSQIVTTSFRTGEMANSIKPASQTPEKERKDGTTNVDLPEPPTRPETPSVTPISTTSVSLMWIPRSNGGSPIEGYRVQAREVDNGKRGWYTINNNLAAGKHSCEVNGLERDTKYRFRVIAFNSGGDSKPSSASDVFPQSRIILRLKNSPQIMNWSVRSHNSITIEWMYENPIDSTVEGYNIHFRSSDKDNERDYEIKPINDPVATSDTLKNLIPGIQYDIKITAFNSRGTSPPSTVLTAELPLMDLPNNPTYEDYSNDDYTGHEYGTHNDAALERVKQKDLIYLIIGGVLGLIVLVLVLSVFCYWRQKAKWNDPKNKINGNGTVNYTGHNGNVNLPKFSAANGNTPSDTKCTCSRHHSGHSSLERDGSHFHGKHPYPYMMPAERYPPENSQNSPNCPHLHNNPLNMYMEYGYTPYMQSNMARMPVHMPPNWFVRGGNGNFCHIIPGDSRKMNAEAMDPGMTNYGNGGAMVLNRFHGNMANGNIREGVMPPQEMAGYKQYENNNQSSTDENPIVHSPKTSCDSDEAATSGVVTQSDVTSRLSEDGSDEGKITKSESLASSSDKGEHENLIENANEQEDSLLQSANDLSKEQNERSSFLNNDLPNNYRKETVIS